jgi:hypothetical protein
MKFGSKIEVSLLPSEEDTIPFPEVVDTSTGDVYVIAVEGKPFVIKVDVEGDSACHDTSLVYNICTKIDGQDVNGYGGFIVSCKEGGSFYEKGFLKSVIQSTWVYELFSFAPVKPVYNDTGSSPSSSLASSKLGTIEITVQESEKDYSWGGPSDVSPFYRISEKPTELSLDLNEGEKFFKAPSLGTVVRETVEEHVPCSPPGHRVVRLDEEPEVYTFRYDTATNLRLRGILKDTSGEMLCDNDNQQEQEEEHHQKTVVCDLTGEDEAPVWK